MPTDPVQLALQAHLAEFSALRQELLEMIKWRERLVFLSLGISGALFSFAFSAGSAAGGASLSREMALYLVPPLAAATGGLWLVNAWRIHRIGSYIRDVLAAKVNTLLSHAPSPGPAAAFEAFSWESSSQRIMHKWSRRLLEWVVLLSAFVFAGVVAQYIIISRQQGALIDRIRALESPDWFAANCAAVFISFLLFANHLLFGRKHRGSAGIRQP
ncbi:MAG: hypothetical protein WCD04_04915 [Terriglobia bacterium]|jgi:hypothetical protein